MKKPDIDGKKITRPEKPKVKRNIRITLGVFTVLFLALICYLCYSVGNYGEAWFATPYNPRISAAKNDITPGSIYDRNGVVLAKTVDGERVYAENGDTRRAVCHVVGDDEGKTVGAETYYARYLYGYNKGLLERLSDAQSGVKQGGDVYLTIDTELCDYIYDNMGFNGAAVVMNYKTGEVLASVSVPTFDPEDIESVDEASSAFVNRATMGKYPPGSTFKIITLAAAIENDTNLIYDCSGERIIDGQRITCPKDGGHGEQGLLEAFENSCNTYFGTLAATLKGDALLAEAEAFGFNEELSVSDFVMYGSDFFVSNSDGDVAWAGIGQYNDLVTPMHNAMIAAAIANGGDMAEPKLLYDVKYDDKSVYDIGSDIIKSCVSAETAKTISDYMAAVVENGTGTSAQVDGYRVCGKTGTAEYYDNDAGEVKNHSWFTAFIDDDAHPLAVSVILEGAGFGSSYAAPLAGDVLSYALNLGY